MRAPPALATLLEALARRPAAEWAPALHEAYPTEPALVTQALLWLAAGDRGEVPELGTARYELVECLDSGASAAVWQARDRVLDRVVAIKVFHERDSDAVTRALAEARVACDVISDHVVRIVDVQLGARAFIVMELVAERDPETGTLALGLSAAARRPRSVREAARWALQIARGVHDAHLRDVFHRDLNPRNVLVTPISRRARLVDFGLAAHGDATAAGPRGTPEYMAPEQARAALALGGRDDREALVAADIWGIGATVYDLLAGRPPWQGGDAWELAAVGASIAPITRTAAGERVPRRLWRIVERLLAPEPQQRYASAACVVAELEAFLAHRPGRDDRSPATRLALWCRRNPQVAASGLAASVLAAIAVMTQLSVDRLRDERAALTQQLATEEVAQRALAQAVAEARATLRQTEQQVAVSHDELRELQRTLAEQREAYVTVLRAKEHALAQADEASRVLVGHLQALRQEHHVAEAGRSLYERYWTSARAEADRTARELARVRTERDQLRRERDRLGSELAGVRVELARVEALLAGTDPATTDDEPKTSSIY